MQTHPEPVFLADDGTYVDVTNFVRLELHHKDIRCSRPHCKFRL